MSYDDQVSADDDDVPVDDTEASEAAGVAEIDSAGKAPPEEAEALDGQTLEGLADEERADLQRSAADFGGSSGPEAAGSVALSANFVLAEFHCCRGHCPQAFVPSSAVPALRRLVTQVLQPMRNKFGACTVNSGFRNKVHNEHVGGEPASFHRYDLKPHAPAADVTFTRGSVNEWAAEARRLLGNDVGGVGRYPQQNFVHIDEGPARKWDG